MPRITNTGFTLIELFFVLGLIGLFLTTALPSLEQLVQRSRITAEVTHLRGLLQSARKVAITHSKYVTICPTEDGQNCSKNWSPGYMGFIDSNKDRRYNDGDDLLFQHKLVNQNIKLRWRAFGVRSSLQWHFTGITNHQNGSFEYCYQNEPMLSRGLFVSKAGRIRPSRDTNGDGIHENARGKNIQCI